MAPKAHRAADSDSSESSRWVAGRALYQSVPACSSIRSPGSCSRANHTSSCAPSPASRRPSQTPCARINTRSPPSLRGFKHNLLKATTDGAVAVDNLQDSMACRLGRSSPLRKRRLSRGPPRQVASSPCRTPPTSLCWAAHEPRSRERNYNASIARSDGRAYRQHRGNAQLVSCAGPPRAFRGPAGYANHSLIISRTSRPATRPAVPSMIHHVAPRRSRAPSPKPPTSRSLDRPQAQVSWHAVLRTATWD